MSRNLASVTMTPERVAEMMGFPEGTSLVHAEVDPVSHRAYLVFDGPQWDETPAGAIPDVGVLFTYGEQESLIVDVRMAGGLQLLAEEGITGPDAVTAYEAWRGGEHSADTERVTKVLGEPR